MTLIIPEDNEQKSEDGGNRKHRRTLEARKRGLPAYRKKMTAYFIKQTQKKNGTIRTPKKNTGEES